MPAGKAQDGNILYDTMLQSGTTANTETLTGTKTLADTDAQIQFLDPGGAGRDVTLPAVGDNNHPFYIVNTADAAETLTVKNSGGTTIVQVLQNSAAFVASDGATWKPIAHYGMTDDVIAGWAFDSDAWTYASATTFTVTGNVTARFPKGTKIRLKQGGGYKYFFVIAAAYSAPDTTITLTGGTDYSLINAAITDPYYSYAETPQGFPQWFNHSPTWGGFSVNPSGGGYRFTLRGTLCVYIERPTTNGTSNATTYTSTAPIASANTLDTVVPLGLCVDNGSVLTTPGRVINTAGTVTLTLSKDLSGAAWTNANGKRACFVIMYEI
jgi:hypothetical protein